MKYKELIEKSKEVLANADAILIGAGAGLSTAGGLEYGGKRFADHFADFIHEYHLTDMYSSAFYPFKTQEEKWAYFSRHIKLNRYDAKIGQVYYDLLKMVKDKDYFVLTTNGDAQFFRAGFDEKRIFATQGDYSLFQCAKACHDTLYNDEEMVSKMVNQQKDFRIPSDLVPVCPVCGENLVPHLRIDGYFVENEDWHDAAQRYNSFVQQSLNKNLVLIELGVGFNTPGIIRFPFEEIAIKYPNTTLIRMNKTETQGSFHSLPESSILLEGDIAEFLQQY